MTREWECEECGHILIRNTVPRRCPECEATDSFILLFEDEDSDDEEEKEE